MATKVKSYKLITDINLDKCKAGDILIGRHGAVMEYVQKEDIENRYPHTIKYITIPGENIGNKCYGTRASNGYAFLMSRMPETDQDVVSIIRIPNKSTVKKGK